jgi:hypothetical protein
MLSLAHEFISDIRTGTTYPNVAPEFISDNRTGTTYPNKVTHTYIPADKIWRPFVLAENSVDLPTYVDIKDSPILVFSNGTLSWTVAAVYSKFHVTS